MADKNTIKLISILVPCFNEQESIRVFMDRITPILESLQECVEILFVDDGSQDETLSILIKLARQNPQVKVISFSRNFGKEAALTAGLELATGDAVIPVDVDLQDPVELIPQMIEKWKAGADVVLARRLNRPSDSFLKRLAVNLFYKLISALSSTPIPVDVGDYRLMDRRVVNSICLLPERNRFMKGILSWPGYETEVIDFTRPDRAVGRSKWHLWKLFNYALDGIFSFSTAPLRMWTYAGLLLSFFSLAYLLVIISKTLIYGIDLPGYASIVSIILFFSGINLIGLGILGEYLGRVFIEVKQRPVYLIKRKVGFDNGPE